MKKTKRQKISPNRQDDGRDWRVLAKNHARGTMLPPHEHRTGQLVFALSGIMLIETDSSRWTIPPQRALWIPPQHRHAIRILSPTQMRTVYFQPQMIARCRGFARRHEIHAVVASPLIRELVLGLFDEQRDDDTRRLMAQLLLHTLRETEYLPTYLPMPVDEKLRAALMKVISANRWQWSMQDVASLAAMSERTFTRRFTEEVGLSFRAWRQRARIIASLDLLASNRSTKAIAHAMQFSGPAAYVAAFRELLGRTPNVFREDEPATGMREGENN